MTTISTPTQLITAVPFLLNAQPHDSLVFIALREGVIELAIQADLPNAPTLTGEEDFFLPLHESCADQLLLLAYLPEDFNREIAEQISEQLRALCEEIAPVKDFLIIQSSRWRSFLCTEVGCCDPLGEPLPDIASSVIAAEHVFQGLAMPELMVRNDDLSSLLRQAQSEFRQCEPAVRSKRGVVALLRLISYFTINQNLDNEKLVADALVALTDIQVRDFAIGSHGDENLALHIQLWSKLMAIAPEKYRAPVSTLLALLKYEEGDREGALDSLERALCDDPHYSLAHLLQKTFAAGWPPEAFTTMRHELHPKLRAELLG